MLNKAVQLLLLTRHTPLRSLLIVAGETWIFNRKIQREADWIAAKRELRTWISTDNARRAVWHAGKVLRIGMRAPKNPSNSKTYYGDNIAVPPRSPSAKMNSNIAEDESVILPREGEAHLHNYWTLYVASLVCWAWGFDAQTDAATTYSGPFNAWPLDAVANGDNDTGRSSSSSSAASDADSESSYHEVVEMEMWKYLRYLDVPSHEKLPTTVSIPNGGRNGFPGVTDDPRRGEIKGLLECVRRKISGPMGGLLNEAERVLWKLGEGKSLTANF